MYDPQQVWTVSDEAVRGAAAAGTDRSSPRHPNLVRRDALDAILAHVATVNASPELATSPPTNDADQNAA
jgi:hypothetical protein